MTALFPDHAPLQFVDPFTQAATAPAAPQAAASEPAPPQPGASEPAPLEPLSFYELVLRDDPRLDQWVVNPALQSSATAKLLGISVAGMALYGAMVGLVAQYSKLDMFTAAWLGRLPIVTFPIALTLAFLGALAVCLPSFYFYTQLSSLDATFRIVTGQALRAQARTATLLLGVLPVYVAVALGSVVGLFDDGALVVSIGILLPFLVGFAGLLSLARSFRRLSQVLPVAHARRPNFLPRLVGAWGLIYSVVAPVALYRLIEALGAAF